MDRFLPSAGVVLAACLFGLPACQDPPLPVPDSDRATAERYLDAVRQHLDQVLASGRDRYGTPTPLFVDGLEITTLEPARWPFDDHRWILSNLANQQDLLRSLDGFTALTGEERYRDAAEAAVSHHFEHLVTHNGLLLWGGHTCWDAEGDEWVGRRFHWLGKRRSPIHEIKACYPHYELLAKVDPKATAQLIRTFWLAHIRDWSNLDFDRHGGVDHPDPPGNEVWNQDFDPESPVFFQSQGRTFVQTGSDLFYAAGMFYHLEGDRPALEWARNLAGRYVATRHPDTGLRGYQYSNLEEIDRAHEQFGDLFPDSYVSEAAIFDPNAMPKSLLSQMRLANTLGQKDGEIFLTWAIEDLRAIGRHSYDAEIGRFRSMLLDGTDLTTAEMPRDGYFGPKGTSFQAWSGQDYFLCYATASRFRPDDPFLWEMARHTARDSGLGDIGEPDGSDMALSAEPDSAMPAHVVGLIELYRQTGRRDYLDHACRVADRILETRFENRLFTPGPGYRYTRTSRPEPLALLHLAAELLRQPDAVPDYMDGHAYFACEVKSTDTRYTFDHKVIYTLRRD